MKRVLRFVVYLVVCGALSLLSAVMLLNATTDPDQWVHDLNCPQGWTLLPDLELQFEAILVCQSGVGETKDVYVIGAKDIKRQIVEPLVVVKDGKLIRGTIDDQIRWTNKLKILENQIRMFGHPLSSRGRLKPFELASFFI